MQPGTVIAGRYRLEQRIGAGGYGEVYRAEQLGVGRNVAVKLLRRDAADQAAAQRFEREADLARRLEHPNTVRLLDYGVDGEHRYIVFELLKGRSLAQLLKIEGRLSEERTRAIASQIAKSLMEAHAVGIVHRDVKPANIFVAPHAGEPDFVKVLDFGIAKPEWDAANAVTHAGQIVGTPAYMAPEVLTGSPASAASDLYAVGLVMAEMLAGRRVYAGDASVAILAQLSPDPVPLPSEALSSSLGRVIERATRKNPHERQPDAAALLADLQAPGAALAPTQPVTTSWNPNPIPSSATPWPEPSVPRVPARRRPNVARIVAVCVMAAVLLVGVAGFAMFGSCATLLYIGGAPTYSKTLPDGSQIDVYANHFRVEEFADGAVNLARAELPGANLARINAKGKWIDDAISLEDSAAIATYTFTTDTKCLAVDFTKTEVKTRRLTNCDKKQIRLPRCKLKKLLAGTPDLDSELWIELDYASTPTGLATWLAFIKGKKYEVVDAC